MTFWGEALAICVLFAGGISAQTPAADVPSQVVGEVTALDAASRQITVKSDKGATFALTVRENAPVLRLPAGSRDIKTAQRITLAEVSVGDRVAATAHPANGKIEAGSIIVMTKSDLAQERQREQQDWQKRGAGGIVSAVDPAAGTFSVRAGGRTITVRTNPQTDFRRYAPDSVKFSDAHPSSLAGIKDGDQVRVLGDRSEDGGSIAADRVVSGSFRQIAGTVSSIDAQTGEIKITDLATKKPVVVKVNPDSTTMRKLPPMMAAMLARRLQAGRGQQQAARPEAQTAGAGRGQGDLNQMLDRLPPLTLADLKPGDAIMLSSTESADPARATAIMLLAGVEPLLTASPTATRDLMGGWMSSGGEGESGFAQ